MWNTDPDRTVDEILDDIKTGSAKSFQSGKSNISYVLAPLAALLVKLSRDADATASKTLKITDRLYWLTVVLMILTFLLCVKEGIELYEKHYENAENSYQGTKNKKIDATAPGSPRIPKNNSNIGAETIFSLPNPNPVRIEE